ncbi:MAG: formate--tetrahydrofolate ligase [Oscillospiraceae bacterium]|nr:formate--tetrahydrofolate ligase [Oscillospiraceae bacterium]
MTDLEIAQSTKCASIFEIGAKVGLTPDELIPYGHNKAKITEQAIYARKDQKKGKLVLVTAISPTPLGEGKTTTTVGIGEGMAKIGKNAIIALREPSLGPVFGIKGGAAGGGYAQVIPMEDINLHFTGDMHAITAANNLLCAMVDNHIKQGNPLNIDPEKVFIPRCMDMNDRALRQITAALGGPVNGTPRSDSFCITVASEVMAILCLASDLPDLKKRLGNILVAETTDGQPVYARDLKAGGAMCALLKDASLPNLVQTLEHTPCIMHGGPFANIAHGCNSIRATELGMRLADYCITEAGFGSDLGAEKFLDIVCPAAGWKPSCVVLVATARALKYNGGVAKENVAEENIPALMAGLSNLEKHMENMQSYGVPVVVALNRFPADTEAELNAIAAFCEEKGASFACSEGFSKGGEGTKELCEAICKACEKESHFEPVYSSDMSVLEKLDAVAKKIYGADRVVLTDEAKEELARAEALGFGNLPICVAKTQYSLSDDPKKLGKPEHFDLTVRSIHISAGAGFLVCLTGTIMTMPGLPARPAAERIDVDADGTIHGLF